MLRKLIAAFLALFSADALAHDYQVGQVWQYKTRAGEEQSRLTIARIEVLPNKERVFHISLDGLRIPGPNGQLQTQLPHAPVSTETLDKSVVELHSTTTNLPDIREGFAQWREAFDAGEGGVFTISVAEIVDIIELAMRQHVAAQAEAGPPAPASADVPDVVYWSSLGRTETVERLLAAGGDPNSVDAGGYSALQAAAENGHLEIVEMLVAHGADVGYSSEGNSALDLALAAGHANVVEFLRAHGAKQ